MASFTGSLVASGLFVAGAQRELVDVKAVLPFERVVLNRVMHSMESRPLFRGWPPYFSM